MRNTTLRQLRSLQAIHACGKISVAAKELGLTGPAVTLQLKQLEGELGLTLFDRTPDGMRPTDAGLVVLEAARAIDERLRVLADEVDAITGRRAGNLSLGVVSTAKYFAPRLMAAFQQRHPGIKVDLHVANRAKTIDALRRHDLDIVLMGRPPREVPVRSLEFGEHPFVMIAPADHPLAARRGIAKQEVARERFLIREPGSGTRISLEIFFADIPEKLEDLGTELGSNETIKQAVMAGLGIAFISAHTIEQELQLGRLVILDVAGMPIRRQWFSVSRLDRSLSPAMLAFNEFLVTEGRQFLPDIGLDPSDLRQDAVPAVAKPSAALT
jgi:LysR family transcriptional regulator, low CO2-responsive transcriptional regulator